MPISIPAWPSSWRRPADGLVRRTAAPASPSGLARWVAGSWSAPRPVSGWNTSGASPSGPVQWCGLCGSSPPSQTSAGMQESSRESALMAAKRSFPLDEGGNIIRVIDETERQNRWESLRQHWHNGRAEWSITKNKRLLSYMTPILYFLPAIVSWIKAKRLSHISFGFMSSQSLFDPSEQVLPYAHQSETWWSPVWGRRGKPCSASAPLESASWWSPAGSCENLWPALTLPPVWPVRDGTQERGETKH